MLLLNLLARLPTSLLVTSLALAASALPVESVELKVLTPDNFDATVAEGAWFVEHFSPYCHHCRAFAPTWEKLVQHYESMDDPGVHLAQVDCAANGDLCHKHGVTGYPQMMIFKDGEMSTQFKGARDWDTLTSFIDQHAMHTPSKEKVKQEPLAQLDQTSLPNPEGMVKALDSSTFSTYLDKGPAFIKFYAPWCGHCKKLAPIWTQLAAQLRCKLNIAEVNCDNHKDLCTSQGVKGFPSLFYYPGGSESSAHRTEYTGGRKLEQLRRFADMAVAPSLQEIHSEADYEHYVKEAPVVYLFLHSPSDEQALDLLKEASHVLLGSPKLISSSNPELRRRFSIPASFASTPVLLAFKDGVLDIYTSIFPFSAPSPSSSAGKAKTQKEKEALQEWLIHNRLPSALALTQETFQDVMSAPHHPLVVIAAVRSSLDYIVGPQMQDLAKEWRRMQLEDPSMRRVARDVVFTWMDVEKWGEWMKSMYGVKNTGEPSVVIADHHKLIYYDSNAKGGKIALEKESIVEAVKDVLAGHVAYKNSENIIERAARRINDFLTYLEEAVVSHPYRSGLIVVFFFIAFIMVIKRFIAEDVPSSYADYTRMQKDANRLD